jgi:hypothetical protein
MNKTTSLSGQRALLLRLLEESFDCRAWHGPNLRGSIRRVSVEEAVWRPRGGRRNIAEIVLHCAYWKYAVRRRTIGGKRGSFPLKGSNWFALPVRLTKQQWQDYVALLDEQHRALREVIATAPASRLLATSDGRREPAAHVHGVAMHDTYHAGQIRIIKAQYAQTSRAKRAARGPR